MDFARSFSELGKILCVCPHCADLHYLADARPFLAGKRPQSIVNDIERQERQLERIEEQLDEQERGLRDQASAAGLRTAKRLLKKIDPVFSGAGYDPHDVKVIFDPVTYVVFNGMSRGRLREIVLLAKPPDTAGAERMHRSLRRAIDAGNLEFRTLRVDDKGAIDHS
ncbi:Holliday junction resolvase-like protein [Bradyrhizobium sp. RT3a]